MTADTTATAIPGEARNPRINQWLASLQPVLLIGNEWVPARSGKTFETINPATGKVLATVAERDAADVDEAVRVARSAFEEGPWSRMGPPDRGALLPPFPPLTHDLIHHYTQPKTPS